MFYVFEPMVFLGEAVKVEFRHRDCPLCGTRALGREGGITIRVHNAHHLVPIVWTCDRLAFTEYAIRVLRKAGLTGWDSLVEKVRILHRGIRRKVPTYHEVIITANEVSISHNKGVRVRERCPECGRTTFTPPSQGIYVNVSEWDGSDIFGIHELPGTYLVTESFADVIRRRRFRGIELTPAEEWRDSWAWQEEDRRPKSGPERPEYTFDIVEELRRRKAKKS